LAAALVVGGDDEVAGAVIIADQVFQVTSSKNGACSGLVGHFETEL